MKDFTKYLMVLVGFLSFSAFGQSVSITKVSTPAMMGYQNSSSVVYVLKITGTAGTSNLKRVIFSTTSAAGSYTAADVSSFSLGVSNTSSSIINYNLAPSVVSTGNGEFLDFIIPSGFYPYFTVSAGQEKYLYLRASIKPAATVGNTIHVDGVSNPASVEFLPSSTTYTNPSINNAGIVTIASKSIKIETESVPTATLYPSVNSHIYTMKVTSTGGDHSIGTFNFPFTGTLPTTEILAGVQLLQNTVNDINTATSAIPPNYCGISVTITAGSGGLPNILSINNGSCAVHWPVVADGQTKYFFLKLAPKVTAITGATYITNASSNPPNINTGEPSVVPLNLQSGTGTQTVAQPILDLTTETLPALNVYKNASPILYKLKVDPGTSSAVLSSLSFKTRGTYLPADISNFQVAYGTSSAITSYFPSVATRTAGSGSNIENVTFSGLNYAVLSGTPGYIYIIGTLSKTAMAGSIVKVNGSADPVVMACTTAAATLNNLQTDGAGNRTILTSNVAYAALTVPAAIIHKGQIKNVLYKAKISSPDGIVNLNSISFLSSGTYLTGDFTNFRLSITSTDDVNTINTASPVYNLNFAPTNNGETITFTNIFPSYFASFGSVSGDKYLWITADVSPTATTGRTIKLNALTNPTALTFYESPSVTNTLADIAGTQTIAELPITLSTVTTPAANVFQGEIGSPVYTLKVDSPIYPSVITSLNIVTTGTYTGYDMNSFALYYNVTNNPATATYVQSNWYSGGSLNLAFVAFPTPVSIPAGQSGYFFVLPLVRNTAVVGHTIKIDGSANPITLGLSNGIPIITNNQTDVAGIKTIIAATTLPTPTLTASSLTYCSGNAPAGVTLTATSCPSPSQAVWFLGGSSVAFASSNGTLVVTPTVPSTYTVSCMGSGLNSAISGSVTITPVIINQPTGLTASPTFSPSPGSPVVLTATGCGSQTVVWDNLSTANPRTVTPSVDKVYSFRCSNDPCLSTGEASYALTIGPCLLTHILGSPTHDVSSGVLTRLASAGISGKITATNKITGTAKSSYTARAIELLPGFRADTGTLFIANVGGCF